MGEAVSSGFFGKVPARGDFLSRRVPPSVAPAWETWLQELTVSVRESGERGWQDAWLTAPLWHFTLGRSLAAPLGAAGVLIASADRVGRLFPFTLIGAAAAGAVTDALAWAQAAESLAMSALADDFDPAAFDSALAGLGLPPPPRGPNRPQGTFALALDGHASALHRAAVRVAVARDDPGRARLALAFDEHHARPGDSTRAGNALDRADFGSEVAEQGEDDPREAENEGDVEEGLVSGDRGRGGQHDAELIRR